MIKRNMDIANTFARNVYTVTLRKIFYNVYSVKNVKSM